MTRLFIVGKDRAFAQNTKIEDLLDNQIGVYGMNRDTYKFEPFHIDATYDFLQVANGSSEQLSPTFDVGTNKEVRFTKVPYKAPIYNVWRWSVIKDDLGPSDTLTLVIGVKDNLNPRAEYFSVTAGGKSVNKIYEEMAKEVCKSNNFEAYADEAGVVVTTKLKFHYPIEVGGEFIKGFDKCYVCNTATVIGEELVSWNSGSGSPQQIAWWDEKYLPERGNYGDHWSRLDPRPNLFNEGGEFNDRKYDIYTLEGANFISANGDPGREAFEKRHKLIVAFDNENETAQKLFVTAIETGLDLKLRTRLADSPFI